MTTEHLTASHRFSGCIAFVGEHGASRIAAQRLADKHGYVAYDAWTPLHRAVEARDPMLTTTHRVSEVLDLGITWPEIELTANGSRMLAEAAKFNFSTHSTSVLMDLAAMGSLAAIYGVTDLRMANLLRARGVTLVRIIGGEQVFDGRPDDTAVIQADYSLRHDAENHDRLRRSVDDVCISRATRYQEVA